MKKILISILAACAVMAGCNNVIIEDDGYGKFSVELSASDTYIPVTKAGINEQTNEFLVEIVRSSDGSVVKSYQRFGDMPQVIDILSGEYTIDVSSPNLLEAAFNQPIYGTSHDFVVKVGEVTTEKLVCTLQNVKVTMSLSDAFLSELSTYTISVSNGNSASNTLYWTNVSSEVEDQYTTKDLATAGYFMAAPLTVRVDGRRAIDGSEAYHEILISDPNPRDHFIINLDAKVTGSAGFSIEIDPGVNVRDDEDVYVPGFDEDPVEDEEDEDVPGTEDPGTEDPGTEDPGTGDSGTDGSDAIVLEWEGNSDFAVQEIAAGMEVMLHLTVTEGIKDFLITVTSDTPMFMFLVSNMTSTPADYAEMDSIESVEIDLINDPVAVEAMAADGIELPTGSELSGKTSVDFPLSTLVPMIPEMGGAGPDTYHTFNLKVTDTLGNTKDWDLTFHVPAE